MAVTLSTRLARGAASLATVDGLVTAELRAVNGDYVPADNRAVVLKCRQITLHYTPPVAGSLVDWVEALDEPFSIELTYVTTAATKIRLFTPMVLKDVRLVQSGADVTSWELVFHYEAPVAVE